MDNLTGHNRFNRSPRAKQLIEAVKSYPSSWQLIPVEEKLPRLKNWQHSNYSHDEICNFINNGYQLTSKKTEKNYTAYPSGVSILSGDASDGILLVDFDGPSVGGIWEVMGGDRFIASQTRSHSSGKKGRKQCWFKIPDSHRDKLKDFTRHVVTAWGDDVIADSGEMLEFRYNRCQSVLPPSLHPTTGGYKWANEGAIAHCPEWLLKLLVNWADGQKAESEAKAKARAESERIRTERLEAWRAKQNGVEKGQSFDNVSLADFLEFEVLPRLSPEQIFNHPGHNWHYVAGRMEGAPVWRESSSGRSVHVNLHDNTWYDFGLQIGGGPVQYRWMLVGGAAGSTPKGKDFLEVVKDLASDAGLEMPRHNLQNQIKVHHQKTKRQTLTADEFWTRFGAEKAISELQNFISRATWKLWRKNGQPQNIELSAYGTKTLTLLEQADKLYRLATEPQQLALPSTEAKQHIIEFDGVNLPDLSDRPDNTTIKIKRHDLKKVMAELHHKTEPGSVINLSIPAGMGKSHDFGNLSPADFGADVIYCQSQWRNPTVSSIEENSEPVPSKHGGLKKDMGRYTQDGYPYTRHIKDGEEIEEGIDTAGNCQHFQTFKAVRERGVKLFGGKGSANCETCSEYKNDAGKVACSALLARVLGFESEAPQFLRTHPVNLPTLEESKDKQAPVLILDEADKELIGVTLNSFSVAPGDIFQSWGQLNGKAPELAELLKPLAEKALELSEDFDKHYGFQLDNLKRSLNLEDIKAVLKSGVYNLGVDLFAFGENQVNRLLKAIAKKIESLLKPDLFQLFKGCNNPIERVERVKNHVTPNWITPLLYALAGSGSLRVDASGLHFSRHSSHFVGKVASASTTFLASASNHLGELAARLKSPAKRMISLELVDEDKPDYGNLIIKTIKGLQIQGDRRDEGEDSAMVRLRKLINTITSDRSKTYGVIDSKAYYQKWEDRGIQSGYWHSDFTRGGNHFKGKDCLVLIGNPYPKISDLIVDYEATYSRCVNEDFSLDKGFLKFLNRRQDSEQIIQGLGRLRAQNRPDEPLTCWIIADRVNLELIEQTYPGAKIEEVNLLEFCPQAAKARDQKIKHLAQYMREAILSDAPLTRDEVAKSLNFSTGNLSKIVKSLAERAKQPVTQAWKWFKQTVTHALKGTISASDGFCSPDAAWLLDYFPSLLKEVKEKVAEPVEIFEAIALAYEQFGPSAEEIFGHLPIEAAKDFIDFLMIQLGADTLTRSQREEIDDYYRELELATG